MAVTVQTSRSRRIAIGFVATMAVITAAPGFAAGATTIGQTAAGTVDCGDDAIGLVSASPGNQYAAPTSGVIVSWSVLTSGTPWSQKFKAARPAGVNTFTIVGEDGPRPLVANGMNTFLVRIPVQAGDIIGSYYVTSPGDDTGCIAASGYTTHVLHNVDPPPGSTSPYAPINGTQLNLSAQLEPDADNDGFGDETQDQCPAQATTQGACDLAAPETTIKSGPLKTDKPKATFGFESTEAGATFQCKLKGKKVRKIQQKQYGPCTSPKKYKNLDPGKYTFFVFATDVVGNADPTPAKQKFRIVEEL